MYVAIITALLVAIADFYLAIHRHDLSVGADGMLFLSFAFIFWRLKAVMASVDSLMGETDELLQRVGLLLAGIEQARDGERAEAEH